MTYSRLIHYYSPRDGKSQDIKGSFQTLSKTLTQQGIKLGTVNCDKEASLCKSKNIKSSSSYIQLIYGIKSYDYDSKKYEGDVYSSESITNFIQAELPNDGITNIRIVPQVDTFLSTTCTNKEKANMGICLILFTSEYETPLFLKSLSLYFNNKIPIAEVKASNDNLATAFQIPQKQYPILLAVCGGTEKLAYEQFKGNLKSKNFIKDIETFSNTFKNKQKCQELINDKIQSTKLKKSKYLKMTELQLKKLKISELKQAIDMLNIKTSFSDLIEKSDYIKAIINNRNNEL